MKTKFVTTNTNSTNLFLIFIRAIRVSRDKNSLYSLELCSKILKKRICLPVY